VKPSFEQTLDWHYLSYPGMDTAEWYKLLYQSVFGIGHLFQLDPPGSEAARVEMLRRESAPLVRVRFHENLIDPLDEDGRLVRLNLRPYARVARDVADLLPALAETARAVKGTPQLMTERVKLTANWLRKRVPFLSNAMLRLGARYALRNYPPLHHSDWFVQHYHPAYRVVLKELIPGTLRDDTARRAFENRVAMDQRLAMFRGLGYDVFEERGRVVSHARPLPKQVLEVGTGNGGLTLRLAEQRIRLVSVDTDAVAQGRVQLALRFVNQKAQVDFMTVDAQHLPFRDREFALVVSSATFHHLKQADAVLTEMARVCRRRMVIADFNERGLELMRRVHRGEGGSHEEVGGDFLRVPDLLMQLGFDVEPREGEYETTFVARRSQVLNPNIETRNKPE
jgi:ubiquinone/menaquinone biosynthesis C-methylase UbiE